jgi:hypothetical protein
MPRLELDSEDLRRTIRDAMQRLLEGKPIRSDGKLTVKSLATEAGVKRWVLTHRHLDLQKEFRDRCAAQGAIPNGCHKLTAENQVLKNEVNKLKLRVADLSEEVHRFTRIVQVLTLENMQLRENHGKQGVKVRHLR